MHHRYKFFSMCTVFACLNNCCERLNEGYIIPNVEVRPMCDRTGPPSTQSQ